MTLKNPAMFKKQLFYRIETAFSDEKPFETELLAKVTDNITLKKHRESRKKEMLALGLDVFMHMLLYMEKKVVEDWTKIKTIPKVFGTCEELLRDLQTLTRIDLSSLEFVPTSNVAVGYQEKGGSGKNCGPGAENQLQRVQR